MFCCEYGANKVNTLLSLCINEAKKMYSTSKLIQSRVEEKWGRKIKKGNVGSILSIPTSSARNCLTSCLSSSVLNVKLIKWQSFLYYTLTKKRKCFQPQKEFSLSLKKLEEKKNRYHPVHFYILWVTLSKLGKAFDHLVNSRSSEAPSLHIIPNTCIDPSPAQTYPGSDWLGGIQSNLAKLRSWLIIILAELVWLLRRRNTTRLTQLEMHIYTSWQPNSCLSHSFSP